MKCTLCPVECGTDRETRPGRCGVRGLTVGKYDLHPYEEPPFSHTNGAGAVFFGGCSLRCVFCQNYTLSRAEHGKEISPKELAAIFEELEARGADCIDLVTPDHVSDLVAEALSYHRVGVPVVYNSGGYCKVDALERIDPYIDVWMPDLKFVSGELSARYTGRADYFSYASEAIRYMAKKPLVRGPRGELLSGILVRHMVMPGCTSDSAAVLSFLREVLPPEAPVSLLRQYTPMGDIAALPELARRVTDREYRRVTDCAEALGFPEIYTQGRKSADRTFIPVWDF